MTEIDVIRHEIRTHKPLKSEEYNPGLDMLIVVHRNPNDPDDPTEFGHHIALEGVAYRKEMWGLADYASTIDMELRDLERYYAREDGESYGVHPLASITEHYFEVPPVQMQSFNPDYILDQMGALARPDSTDGVIRMTLDVVMAGVGDVKNCLASSMQKTFPCRGMTRLSVESVKARSLTMRRMEEQTQRLSLVPSKALDDVRQMLTDREAELEAVRDVFVNHALVMSQVPEIMRKRTSAATVRRGLVAKENAWI